VESYRIAFPDLAWTQGAHPLERKKHLPGSEITLLEFAPGFEDPAWCRRGHAGYVITGCLQFRYETGPELCREGEAFAIPPGTPHRASNPGDAPVRVFIVSEG
jgi:quercetin dioxygenase-like cupin family protein